MDNKEKKEKKSKKDKRDRDKREKKSRKEKKERKSKSSNTDNPAADNDNHVPPPPPPSIFKQTSVSMHFSPTKLTQIMEQIAQITAEQSTEEGREKQRRLYQSFSEEELVLEEDTKHKKSKELPSVSTLGTDLVDDNLAFFRGAGKDV